jgi:hypothetical protein
MRILILDPLIIDDARNQIDLPTCIYVNNALMLAIDVDHMKMVLAAMIKAIFVVMGEPNVAVRQCPLAMNKWLELVIGHRRPCWDSSLTPTDSPLSSLPNTSKRFLIYSILLGTLIDVVSRCQKPRSLVENEHILPRGPIGYSICFLICICQSHMHYPRTRDS